MEGYFAPKAEEASGEEEGAMAGGTTKSLKAAAASASAVGRPLAMSAQATATAHKAMEAAQQADVEKQAKEANQAKEDVGLEEEQEQEAAAAAAATDAYATDGEGEGDGMSSMEYIMTYKQLPPFEVDLIMGRPVQCTPFVDTEEYKALIADPSTTQQDIDAASDAHKEHLNTRIRFHDYVRSEYKDKGYVTVTDEYIARRAQVEEFSRKLWENAFSDSDSEDDFEERAN